MLNGVVVERMRWLTVVLFATLCVSACGLASAHHDTTTPRAFYDAPWHWTDDSGNDVRLGDLTGKPVVLSMFYRGCSTMCPLTLSRMQALEQAFADRHIDARFVLVTLDPRNDNPSHLASYRALHELSPERWTLLTGPLEQTQSLARLLTIHRVDDDAHIIHDIKIVVVSADGHHMRTFDGWNFDDASAFVFGN